MANLGARPRMCTYYQRWNRGDYKREALLIIRKNERLPNTPPPSNASLTIVKYKVSDPYV